MRTGFVRPAVIAAIGLIALGAIESLVSARQLAELPPRARPQLAPAGTLLTGVGFLLSVAIYLWLGRTLARAGLGDGAVVRGGAVTGIVAGAVGGGLRAVAVSDYLADALDRVAVPPGYLQAALVLFVIGAIALGAVGGGALTFLGARLGRQRTRPPR